MDWTGLCGWFVCSLRPNQQFFSHVGMGLPGLNQYKEADKVSCSRTQHSDSAGGETQTSNPSIPTLRLYQLSCCPSPVWFEVLLFDTRDYRKRIF